jgi:hypothetical protein
MTASSLAPSFINNIPCRHWIRKKTPHIHNIKKNIESTIKYVMYIIYLTIYAGVIFMNLVKTWAPLRFKISLWLALRGATGQEIGG